MGVTFVSGRGSGWFIGYFVDGYCAGILFDGFIVSIPIFIALVSLAILL